MHGEPKAPSPPTPAEQPRPAVLVVEDEILLRTAAAWHLRDAGFAVIEAASASEAMRVVGANSSVALVFSDVNLPGSHDGLDLLRWLERNHPRITVLLTSGRGEPLGMDPRPRALFLAKPYSFSELERRVSTLLAAGREA